VLVELFTSEGCSSCPPADQVLAQLAGEQPVAAAEVVALSEHVDYWDRLGWRDAFSSAAFTARQSVYGRTVFRAGEIYTPQMVVGGQVQLTGSDRAAAIDAIARVASEPQPVAISASLVAKGSGVEVRVQAAPRHGATIADDIEVLVAAAEDGLVRDVTAGENRGRRLAHTGVVRTLVVAGHLTARAPALDVNTALGIRPGWNRARLRVVVFAQNVTSGRVLGVAGVPMS